MLAVVLAACSAPAERPPPKRPNNELIVGDFERHKPDGETTIRFDIDGKFRLARTRAEIERTPYLGEGTYKLDGDQLTFTSEKGACTEAPGDKDGTYKVVLSKIGIRFVKLTDSCQRRSAMDGQTWWRTK
ncbi:MAG: hypothetical protein H6Q90_3842 [Deltaproteobacteria bacterium]|nr:hypothetical protein [Deltaproteobacteria bacterium]